MAKAIVDIPNFKHLSSDIEILTEKSFTILTSVSSCSLNGDSSSDIEILHDKPYSSSSTESSGSQKGPQSSSSSLSGHLEQFDISQNSSAEDSNESSDPQNGSQPSSNLASGSLEQSKSSPVISADNSKWRSSALKFPPCVICGGKASGQHYGCNTCEACKNFFRRCLSRKNSFVCSEQNNCAISHTNKSNCSACRLAVCLGQGMCKTKSKLGRYSYSKRTETIKKAKKLEHNGKSSRSSEERSVTNTNTVEMPASGSSTVVTDGKANYDRESVDKLTATMEDIQLYEKEFDNEEVRNARFKEHHEKFLLKTEMFGSMNAVSKEEYQTLLKTYGIDIDGQYEATCRLVGVWEGIINRYCNFAKKLTGFSELSYNDQSNLLKATHCSAFAILLHQGYSEEYKVFLEANGEAFHLDELADRFMSRSYVMEGMKYLSYLQKLKLTKEEMALLIAISTFSGNGCKLENPEFVEKVQFDFVELLSRHLNATLDKPEATRRFIKLMDSLVRIRYFANIYYQEMKAWKSDSFLAEMMPVYLSLLPNDD